MMQKTLSDIARHEASHDHSFRRGSLSAVGLGRQHQVHSPAALDSSCSELSLRLHLCVIAPLICLATVSPFVEMSNTRFPSGLAITYHPVRHVTVNTVL